MPMIVHAVHTFVAEHGDELDFQAGDEIIVLEKDDAFGDGWWKGRNKHGDEGLFPATYVAEPSPPSPSPGAAASTLPESSHAAMHPPSGPPSPKALPSDGSKPAAATTLTTANGHLAAPISREPSPFSQPAGQQPTLLDTAAATVGAAATGAANVMGRTIGEIQDAIENITQPDPTSANKALDNGGATGHEEEEEELGIGQDARARLAAQAQLQNEKKGTRGVGDGVAGLVYSDESDEEEDDEHHPHHAQKAGGGVLGMRLPPNGSEGGGGGLKRSQSRTPPVDEERGMSVRSLQPALPLPSTPPFEKSKAVQGDATTGSVASGGRASSGAGGVPARPPATWSVDDVVDWAKAKGFDESIWSKFIEHEISGDLLLELDANLLKELDIPQFGKRLRIAQAISDLRRPSSMISASSAQQMSPIPTSTGMSQRGMSAPPVGGFGSTPPLSTPPPEDVPYGAWNHSRKTSGVAPMEAIREGQQAPSTAATATSTAGTSMPVSPVTPSSATLNRNSTGSSTTNGHKKGKPSLDKDRLSFFGRTRKPAPRGTPEGNDSAISRRDISAPVNKTHQMQPASPNRRISGGAAAGAGNASALQQIGKPDHAGYMKKKGDRYGWKTRYFVLKGNHLYYLKSELEDRVKGHIDLTGHRVIVDENTNPGHYGFRLVGQERPHYFSSSEQSQVREWMKALMKATIARDYSVPVTSSCNIPTIPLAEAQALQPRPPSPATREATQRATRRENTNQLTAHDASVLMSLDTSSGQRRRASQTLGPALSRESVPRRPSRDTRRPSSVPPGTAMELVTWVNRVLPQPYPRATALPESFVSGELIFLLVRSLSGVEPSPPVPPNAFSPDAQGQPNLSGLFAMMDMLIDAGVDTAGVSINDVRSGEGPAIVRLVESIKGWHEVRAGVN